MTPVPPDTARDLTADRAYARGVVADELAARPPVPRARDSEDLADRLVREFSTDTGAWPAADGSGRCTAPP